jgi:hypothetical protein
MTFQQEFEVGSIRYLVTVTKLDVTFDEVISTCS